MAKKIDEYVYDVRTVERHVRSGLISKKDYEKFLSSLEDSRRRRRERGAACRSTSRAAATTAARSRPRPPKRTSIVSARGPIRATRGTERSCKGWVQEAALRCS
jgi:hypothetical protein